MNCHDVKERLAEGRATAGVRRHVESCSDCASFARELEEGGREIADAFLAVSPSAGFEGRVARRMMEREISARPRPAARRARVLAPALFLLLLAAGVLLFRPGRDVTAPPAPGERPAAEVVRTLTAPNLSFPLEVVVRRESSGDPTTLVLVFAHEERAAPLGPGLEDEMLNAWARGAREALVRVGAEVPTREVHLLVEVLDRLGYSWEIARRKVHPEE